MRFTNRITIAVHIVNTIKREYNKYDLNIQNLNVTIAIFQPHNVKYNNNYEVHNAAD